MSDVGHWTASDLPDMTGKVVVVTGANSGIGFEAARELARHGAHVVLACRNVANADGAAARIRAEEGNREALLEAMPLDLASLASVRTFAASFAAKHRALDVLCNNAGVMALPYRKTADGFEMQFGTNHLGHFALTGLLLEQLQRAKGARVVTVSSGVHRFGRIDFDDLQGERRYGKWRAYCQSKLANLLFAYELQRRLDARGLDVKSVACHPGYAATNLQAAGARLEGSTFSEKVTNLGNRLFAQDAAKGALPTLYAAAAPDVRSGDFYGPDGAFEAKGHPKKVKSNALSYDAQLAERLWRVSEELTGVTYAALRAVA